MAGRDRRSNMLVLRIGLAFCLAVVIVVLFVIAVGWEDVLSAAAEATLPIYLFAILATCWCLVARAYVWHRLLGVVDQPRPPWLIGSVFLTGMFAKYITPYGQVTSGVGYAAVVSRYYETAYEESLAGILSADFLNYVPYYTFGGIGLGYVLVVDTTTVPVHDYVGVSLATGTIVLLSLVLLWYFRESLVIVLTDLLLYSRRLIRRVSPSLAERLTRENVEHRFRGFSVTLRLLSNHRSTMVVAILSAHVAWLGLAGALYFSALAVGLSLPVGIVFLCVTLSKLGFVVPTPGGIGGVEIALASMLFLFTPMGGAVATAVAILYRVATYWFTILLGGVSSVALTLADPTPP